MSNAFTGNEKDDNKRSFVADENGDAARNVVDKKAHNLLSDIAANTGGASSTQGTYPFSGSAQLTNTLLPPAPIGEIKQVYIQCRVQTPSSKRLLYSLDGGSTFNEIAVGGAVAWEPKDIEQIVLKGNVANVLYDVLMNIED